MPVIRHQTICRNPYVASLVGFAENFFKGDVARSFTSPELVAKTEALGFEVLASSPETALKELRTYSTKWAQLVKERNIRIEWGRIAGGASRPGILPG
jgi:hypothetical protein